MARWVMCVIIALILATVAGLVYEFGDSIIPDHKLSSLGNIPATGAVIFGVIGIVIIALFLTKRRRR